MQGPAEYFHVSQEVIILTVTLYVLGFGIGDSLELQWVYWVTLCFAGAVYVLMSLTVPETHHATIGTSC
jgi:hypothetical protein